MIRHHLNFFSKKNFVYFEFFFVLRLKIVISFDVMTKKTATTKKRKNLILLRKIKQTWKIFEIILLTETLKKNLKINNDREKRNDKKREKNYKTINKNFITTVKRVLSKFKMFIKTLKTKATLKNETSN